MNTCIYENIGFNGLRDKKRDFARNVFKEIWAKLFSFFLFLKSSYKIIFLMAIVAIISVVGTIIVSILLSSSDYDVYLPSLGTIKTIEVETFWDPNGENRIEVLSWEEIKIEKREWDEIIVKPVNNTIYVKSVSNFRVTLDMFLTDWSPVEISDYITVSWNYNGTILDPGEIVPVTINLSGSSSDAFVNYLVENKITRFDVVIHIVASD
jgi:hypothetical protein